MRKTLCAVLLAGALAACGDEAAEDPSAPTAAQLGAARHACIATELARRTADELATLEEIGSPGLVAFARALDQHAQLRLAAYAQQDSALRHSPTPEDSARHAELAARYEISAPEPETVEESVIRDYQRKFGTILADADHRCNWEAELEPR